MNLKDYIRLYNNMENADDRLSSEKEESSRTTKGNAKIKSIPRKD